ncbi:MAG: hypothetical protein V3T25_02580, partial [Gemmatimonadota bacterium]
MRVLRAVLVLSALMAVHAGEAMSQIMVEPLSIDEAVSLAREANPVRRAARLRADVAAERVPQAGALPDPILGFTLMNRQIKDFGSTAEPMLQNRFEFSQRLPWPGKLG